MDDFRSNPCRHHLFEVFALDPSETDLYKVRKAVEATWGRLGFGKIVARDGTEIKIGEADLNRLKEQLLTPLSRLQAEQFVHRPHPLAGDPELARAVERLAAEERDATAEVVAAARTELVLRLVKEALPAPPPPLADDLPWPPEPGEQPLRRESLAEAVLRDR